MSGATLGEMRRVLLIALAAMSAALLATGCIPQNKGPVSELNDEAAGKSVPTFPAAGSVTATQVIDGLVFDFTNGPPDLDLWTPPEREARCAARKIVSAIGAARLVELGYLPGEPQSAVNQLDLSDAERRTIAKLFSECVDTEAAVASLLSGKNFLSGRAAACVARGLKSAGQLGPFVEAWAFSQGVDPFAGGANGLAPAVLSYADVCIADSAFDWSLQANTTTSSALSATEPSTTGP